MQDPKKKPPLTEPYDPNQPEENEEPISEPTTLDEPQDPNDGDGEDGGGDSPTHKPGNP